MRQVFRAVVDGLPGAHRVVVEWRVPILGHRIGPAGGGHVGSVSVRVLMSEMVTHPAAQRPGASRN